jgi:hypothetical protein
MHDYELALQRRAELRQDALRSRRVRARRWTRWLLARRPRPCPVALVPAVRRVR